MDEEAMRVPVVIGITRPIMILGIPYNMALILMFSVTGLWLLTNSFYSFLSLPFLYSIVFSITVYDSRYLDVIGRKIAKTPNVPNRHYWGGNSYGV